MKVRDSGMPEADYWDSLFDVERALDRLGVTSSIRDLVEFGCGYGTFTLPAARRISGTLHALDLDDDAMKLAECRAREGDIRNIRFVRRDFIVDGTGLRNDSMDYAMVFNILHHENPEEILSEAFRIIRPGGIVGVMHWIHSDQTPRGPSLEIRPKPAFLRDKLIDVGFSVTEEQPIDCPPWHYGLIGRKT